MGEGRTEDVMATMARVRVRRGLTELLGGVALLKATEVAEDLVATGAIDELTARRAVFEVSARLIVKQSPADRVDGPWTAVTGGEPVAAIGSGEEVAVEAAERPVRSKRAGGDPADMEANLAMPLTALNPHRCPVCKIPIRATSAGCLAHWRQARRRLAIEGVADGGS